MQLALTMTSQSVVKHFLTEGDKLILSWFSPLQDQGGYAVAVNYGRYPCCHLHSSHSQAGMIISGSLVARIVFQPLEETSRLYFSKFLANASSTSAANTPKIEILRQVSNTLLALLSVQAAMSVIFLVFGTAYVPIILYVLLPQQYLLTSAPRVLSAWVWYIPVLAFNGSLEAFSSSIVTPQDLNRQSR